jgi:hypothetical protein
MASRQEVTLLNFYVFNSTYGPKEGEVYMELWYNLIVNSLFYLCNLKLSFVTNVSISGGEENLVLLSFKN